MTDDKAREIAQRLRELAGLPDFEFREGAHAIADELDPPKGWSALRGWVMTTERETVVRAVMWATENGLYSDDARQIREHRWDELYWAESVEPLRVLGPTQIAVDVDKPSNLPAVVDRIEIRTVYLDKDETVHGYKIDHRISLFQANVMHGVTK